jgi:phage anti-repressor protein
LGEAAGPRLLHPHGGYRMTNIVTVVDFEADIEKPFPIPARRIWKGLNIRDHFTDWAKDQIERAQLVESVDYLIYRGKPEKEGRGRPTKEYYLTTNAAEHIALMSNTAKGHEYRQALINIKNKVIVSVSTTFNLIKARDHALVLSELYDLFKIPEHIKQIEITKTVKRDIGVDLAHMLSLSPSQDSIKEEEIMLEPTECARRFGFQSANEFNKWLHLKGYQYKTPDGWQCSDFAKSYCSKHSWSKGNKSGYNLKWKTSFIESIIK